MPFTAVVWNIEQFGLGRGGLYQTFDTLRCALIATIINKIDADVVVIQELRSDGIDLLKNLQVLLNGNWHFDWLPAAQVVSGVLATFDQLNFVQTANSEGYGVLWRDGKLDALPNSKMSAGLDTLEPERSKNKKRDHYMDLSSTGKKLKFTSKPVPITFDELSKSEAIGFPQSICAQAVNRIEPRVLRSGSEQGDESIPQVLNTRRPCRVQLHVSNTRSVPLVVYHAPVGQKSSRSPIYGTLVGCAVDQLQGDECVYAGDFNVFNETQQNLLLEYLPTIDYEPPEFTPSMVHVFKDKQGTFRTGDGIYGSARDIAFVKAPTNAPTATIRKVTELDIKDKNSTIWTFLTSGPTLKTMNEKIVPMFKKKGVWKQVEVDVVNIYLLGQTNYPHGADAYTAAAIIYTGLMSDHLPIVITYK